LHPAGLAAYAYLTATGAGTLSLDTTTVFPSISAFAHTQFLSSPAIAKTLQFAALDNLL